MTDQAVTIDRPVAQLTDDEAWQLLADNDLGRIALSFDGQPDIYPVNYYSGDGKILFRTGEGTKLAELSVNENVAFEVDDHDAVEGWSVVAKGVARVLITGSDIAAADALPLKPWIPTIKYNYVEITVNSLSARRFVFGAEPDRYPV